ncbi:anthranilate synthase component I [candidate division GN15 bacterium]|uniref:Anthranilate synthase component 1 n=1 Tax=candidate division GN15 bacterium TaxID=2072418 RepID=A0A855WXJ6_9BACT|nr:MAG: anthranilate synthase component I [candidate division GN15 bacterium]
MTAGLFFGHLRMEWLEILTHKRSGKIRLVPRLTTLPGDLETPVSVFLKFRPHGARFLLESADGVGLTGRYSFIGMRPKFRIDLFADHALATSAEHAVKIPYVDSRNPFDILRKLISSIEITSNPLGSALLGGLVGHINYEAVGFIEPRLKLLENGHAHPVASFYLVDTLFVFDHFKRQMQAMALVENGNSKSSSARGIIEEMTDLLKGDVKFPGSCSPTAPESFEPNVTKSRYEQLVEVARENIFKGNIFQLVLSQAQVAHSPVDGFQVYRALRMLNPSPYMFYLDMDNQELIGSSPEVMVRLNAGKATLRPIAGTRPRGESESEDIEFEKSLVADEKELAEHTMLVDLGRNDLGRTCKYGSVTVERLMQVERFSHVMHLTSTVTGQLLPGKDQFDLFSAVFPAGTVTGAPKVRAMQLISEMENTPRGPYAGCVGYFSLSGDMDMCITIRTVMKQGSSLRLQAGAGLVADSVPEREYQETLNKLQALKDAIRIAEGGFHDPLH